MTWCANGIVVNRDSNAEVSQSRSQRHSYPLILSTWPIFWTYDSHLYLAHYLPLFSSLLTFKILSFSNLNDDRPNLRYSPRIWSPPHTPRYSFLLKSSQPHSLVPRALTISFLTINADLQYTLNTVGMPELFSSVGQGIMRASCLLDKSMRKRRCIEFGPIIGPVWSWIDAVNVREYCLDSQTAYRVKRERDCGMRKPLHCRQSLICVNIYIANTA